ncbi:hypothetical protein F4801DRAFT_443676 [Xylaria longipes]|nr:hypothetical protein F4801DRAFT_443676 [Xylaria longipes]
MLHYNGGTSAVLPLCFQQWANIPNARVSLDLTTLHLWAGSLGECKVLFQFSSTISDVLQELHTLLRPEPSKFLSNELFSTINEPETIISRLTRFCIAHNREADEFSTDEILEAVECISQGERGLSESQLRCRGMVKWAAKDLAGQPLLITDGGLFSMGVSVTVLPAGYSSIDLLLLHKERKPLSM